jgi:hypothetical protein
MMNQAPGSSKILPETPRVESPDVCAMQTLAKSGGNGVRIALAIALLLACAVNVVLGCAWL